MELLGTTSYVLLNYIFQHGNFYSLIFWQYFTVARRLGFLMQYVVPLKFYPTNENVLLMTYQWSVLALSGLEYLDITLYNDVMPDKTKYWPFIFIHFERILTWTQKTKWVIISCILILQMLNWDFDQFHTLILQSTSRK